jgi:hypothetical protein
MLMSKVSRRPAIKSALLLVVAIVAGSCSEHPQPANRPAKARGPSTVSQHQVAPPASITVYPDPLEAAFEILRLASDAFPQLPESILSILRTRGCAILQTSPTRAAQNVIHGDFFGESNLGWAVLCSSGGLSAILVFRDDFDADSEELARREDMGNLQHIGGGKIGYSREITAVDRNYIMRHYQADSGPEPPPIDHQGIDDAFLEKASAIHCWHQGKWLLLQGAD